jgi:hypothetical protein
VLRGTRHLALAWWAEEDEEPVAAALLEPSVADLYRGLALDALACPGEAARCLHAAVRRGLDPDVEAWVEEVLSRLGSSAGV